MRGKRSHSVHTAFILLLLCVFALAMLLTLVMGARVYRQLTAAGDESYAQRTGLSYLAEKVRHGDEAGAVRAGEFHGLPALYLYEVLDDTQYDTIIYVYDGWLCELYIEHGVELQPQDGSQITPMQSLTVEQAGESLLRLSAVASDGSPGRLYLSIRSGGWQE